MKIWLTSDLHVDTTQDWDLPPPAERPDFDVLVVAGDLMPGVDRGIGWLARRVTDRPVVYVPGNHEFYGSDINREIEKGRKAAEGSNVVLLENDTVRIGNTTFIGCTLWTDFALHGDQQYAMLAAADRMNDFRAIRVANYSRRLRPADTLQRHATSRAFIERELARPGSDTRVIVSHHAPHPSMLATGTESDIISAAYASDLSALLDGRAAAWISGHTHATRDIKMAGRTRLLSQPKGYGPDSIGGAWQNDDFDPCFTFEI